MAKPSRAADQKRLVEERAKRPKPPRRSDPAPPKRKPKGKGRKASPPESAAAPDPTDGWEVARDLYPEEVRARVERVRKLLSIRALIAIEYAECLTLQAALKLLKPGKSYALLANTYMQSRKLLAKLVAEEGGPTVNDAIIRVPEFLRLIDVASTTIDVGDEVMATPDPSELPDRYR